MELSHWLYPHGNFYTAGQLEACLHWDPQIELFQFGWKYCGSLALHYLWWILPLILFLLVMSSLPFLIEFLQIKFDIFGGGRASDRYWKPSSSDVFDFKGYADVQIIPTKIAFIGTVGILIGLFWLSFLEAWTVSSGAQAAFELSYLPLNLVASMREHVHIVNETFFSSYLQEPLETLLNVTDARELYIQHEQSKLNLTSQLMPLFPLLFLIASTVLTFLAAVSSAIVLTNMVTLIRLLRVLFIVIGVFVLIFTILYGMAAITLKASCDNFDTAADMVLGRLTRAGLCGGDAVLDASDEIEDVLVLRVGLSQSTEPFCEAVTSLRSNGFQFDSELCPTVLKEPEYSTLTVDVMAESPLAINQRGDSVTDCAFDRTKCFDIVYNTAMDGQTRNNTEIQQQIDNLFQSARQLVSLCAQQIEPIHQLMQATMQDGQCSVVEETMRPEMRRVWCSENLTGAVVSLTAAGIAMLASLATILYLLQLGRKRFRIGQNETRCHCGYPLKRSDEDDDAAAIYYKKRLLSFSSSTTMEED